MYKSVMIAIHELQMYVQERDIFYYKVQEKTSKVERDSENHIDLTNINDAISNNEIKINDLSKTTSREQMEIIDIDQ